MATDPLTVQDDADDEPWLWCDHGTACTRPCPHCEARAGNRAVALAAVAALLCIGGLLVLREVLR